MVDPNELHDGINNISLEGGDSFLYCNIESADFVAVESRTGDLGRVVVATKDVAIGIKIIRERPILVNKSGDWSGMISAFMALDKKSKNGVLNMFHPPLSSQSVQSQHLKLQAEYLGRQLSMDSTLVHKLMAISNCNGHEYYGCDNELYHEAPRESFSRKSSGKMALFLFGSKVAHSCNPNVTYSSRTSDGKLEYKVICSIKAGDMVTFSYIDELLETPTHIRRTKLIDTKSFLCRCSRCLGPDFSRPFSCNKCSGGVVLCTDPQGDSPVWSCSGCGAGMEKEHIETLENEFKKDLDGWDCTMMNNLAECPTSIFKKQIARASSKLHPHHYHTLRSMTTYIRLCASHSFQMEKLSVSRYPRSLVASIHRKIGTPTELRSEAAKMGVSIVEKLECIAAGCNGPESTGRCTEHAPVQYACQLAFHVAQDMMQCPRSTWPANGRYTVHRYIPAMRRQFGEEDVDVANIERNIPVPEEQGDDTSPIKKPTSISNTKKKSNQHSKKGGRTNKNKKKKGRKK